jgi:hypothetical protein
MSKKTFLVLGSVLILSLFSTLTFAQETVTKTTTTTKKEVVQNPDGTWTVVEYPVNKEVVVQLTPGANLKGTGTAHIVRSDDSTAVNLDLSGMPADVSKVYAYAVAPTGAVSLLGPVDLVNGVASQSFNTPLNQFMLVLSPTENLSEIGNETPVVFRSALPTGYAVVPRAITSAGGSKQVATSQRVNSAYDVPLLGVPSFGTKTTEIRINFKGQLSGLKGKAYIDSGKSGSATQIKMRFDDMKMAPKEKRFVLWASSPEGKYVKLGQVINSGPRQESEIRSETALSDFGLFVTVEDTDVDQPTSTIYSVFGTGD